MNCVVTRYKRTLAPPSPDSPKQGNLLFLSTLANGYKTQAPDAQPQKARSTLFSPRNKNHSRKLLNSRLARLRSVSMAKTKAIMTIFLKCIY